jgi:hypothetical protein
MKGFIEIYDGSNHILINVATIATVQVHNNQASIVLTIAASDGIGVRTIETNLPYGSVKNLINMALVA